MRDRRGTAGCGGVAGTGSGWRIARVLAATALLASGAGGQVPDGDPRFRSTVEVPVVNVDVLVTDREGAPVLDLGRDDFRLTVDGRPVPLSHFAPPEALGQPTRQAVEQPAAAEPAPEPSPEDRQYVVVFVDLTNLDRQRLRAGLEQIASYLGGGDLLPVPVMVVSFDGRVRVCQSFTRNREALMASLDCCRESSAVRLDLGFEKTLMKRRIAQVVAQEVPPSDPSRGNWERMVLDLYYQIEQQFDEIARNQTEAVLDGLRHCVRLLSGIPGRKSMVLLSDGIDAHATRSMFEYWRGTFQRIQVRRERDLAEALQRSLPRSQGYPHAAHELRDLVAGASASRITVHTISSLSDRQLRSISAEGALETSAEAVFSEMSEEIVLYRVSDLTGGSVLTHGPQLAEQLGRVAEEMRQLYRLAFVPPVADDGGYHTIEVAVLREGVSVRHRKGWRASDADDELVARTLAAATLAEVANPLDVKVRELGRQATGSGSIKVDLMITVPIARLVLLPQEGTHDGSTSLCLVIRDAEDRLSAVHREAFPVSVPEAQLERAMTSSAGIRKVLELSGKGGLVAIGVRDDVGNVVATTTLGIAPAGG